MRSKLRYAILGGCLAALLIASLSGCATTSSPTPPANWYWEFVFDTGDSCNSKTVELPMDGKVTLDINGENLPWGNVPKMWIYLNGKQVQYDVGRLEDAEWTGKVKKGDKVEFKGCAETHGKSAGVGCSISYSH